MAIELVKPEVIKKRLGDGARIGFERIDVLKVNFDLNNQSIEIEFRLSSKGDPAIAGYIGKAQILLTPALVEFELKDLAFKRTLRLTAVTEMRTFLEDIFKRAEVVLIDTGVVDGTVKVL